ncbi:hypothetical protein MPSEU_000236300 [Mayamaea pseudoterrestris]|nr:hypothetical protein MPSEU_000236300 [Mayamaea pseudoterrestris]
MSLQALDSNAAASTAAPASPPSPTEGQIGYKLPPICHEQKLKETAMTAEELSKMAFEVPVKIDVSIPLKHGVCQGLPIMSAAVRNHHEATTISSSSSTCSTSDAECNPMVLSLTTCGNTAAAAGGAATPPSTDQHKRLDRDKLDQINAKVSQSKTSRQGRNTQRWVPAASAAASAVGSDQEDCAAEHIRLVTGCVPILKGGKILLVSASRKAEWILPKGGWEMDETMEESAIREVFEEAGVLGVLGPRLSDFQYETRKSKKRKLDQAEQLEKKLKKAGEESSTDTDEPVVASVEPSPAAAVVLAAIEAGMSAPISTEDMSRIRSLSQEVAPKTIDETASCTSGHSSAYSQVRMTLFPLYVNKVLPSWPEQGRFRMAVDIDTAIEMQASRPEFKAALMEVKERGLHLAS